MRIRVTVSGPHVGGQRSQNRELPETEPTPAAGSTGSVRPLRKAPLKAAGEKRLGGGVKLSAAPANSGITYAHSPELIAR